MFFINITAVTCVSPNNPWIMPYFKLTGLWFNVVKKDFSYFAATIPSFK